MTYLSVRHLDPMEDQARRYFGSRAEEALAIIGAVKENRRDKLNWLALADLAEECGYAHVWDFRSRIDEYFE
jgi:hypothetical protein